MAYHMDFSKTSLADLKAKLERTDLIPSQLPLMEGIDGKLAALKRAGVSSLEDLSRSLKGKRGPAALAEASGVEEGYLVLMRRAIEGFRPKPVGLGEYPGIPPSVVRALEGAGIRDSKALFEAAPDAKAAAALARRAGVPAAELRELLCLADLSRIQWVGAAFARALYAAGYRSPRDIAAATAEAVYEAAVRANADGRYYKGKVGLRDMGRLVALAGDLA